MKKIRFVIIASLVLVMIGVFSVLKYCTDSAGHSPIMRGLSTDLSVDRNWPEWKSAEDLWREVNGKRPKDHGIDAKGLQTILVAANAKAAKGESCEAVESVRQALELGADDANTWLTYSDLQQRCNDPDAALLDLLIAEGRQPSAEESAKLYPALAILYANRGDAATPQTILALEKALQFKTDPKLQLQLSILRGQILSLTSNETTIDNDSPVACFTFSWPLHDDGTVAYEDFIATDPSIKIAAIPAGKQLCLRGFVYGQTYQVTLKSGMPALGVAKLDKDEVHTIEIKNRDPRLTFQANTYVLPRLNNVGIPLKGVNVDVASVEILQINDRNLVSQIIEGRALNDAAYSYQTDQIRQDHGRSLWKGFINLKRVDNQTTTTAIPFAQMVKQPVPGLYLVLAKPAVLKSSVNANTLAEAENDPKSDYIANPSAKNSLQWIVVTDVGLTVYQGQDGLRVMTRSYNTGLPLNGVKLKLVSRDNSILAQADSDQNGHVHFDAALLKGENGQAVKLIQAVAGSGDFTFLDLQQPTLDLSDNNVDGKPAITKFDSYIYSDRGIYRPGDDIHLSILLRDRNASALPNAPQLTVKIQPPNDAASQSILVKAHDVKLGGYHTAIHLPQNARLGVWRISLFADPTEPSIGDYSVEVEDFVPARMAVKISVPKEKMLKAGESIAIPVQADYLYGAPVKNAHGDGSLDLNQASNAPFAQFADYTFGLLEAPFSSKQQKLTLSNTDDKGQSLLEVRLDSVPATTHPLEALIHASVFDDTGRTVNQTATIPVTRVAPFLGIKSMNATTTVDDSWNFSSDRNFAIIAVDRSGKRVAYPNLRYRLVKEEYHYDWFAERGRRNYQPQTVDVPMKTGAVSLIASQNATIAFNDLRYGTYRLEVFDPAQVPDRLSAVSTRFNVGWTERALTAKDKPDGLQLRLDHPQYRAGDTAKLFIKAPFAGSAEVILANETVISQQLITLPAKGTTVSLPVGKQWGPGVYALVHAYRPGEQLKVAVKDQTVPGRAIGAIWLAMDPLPRTLQVQFTLPEKMTPNQTLQVPIQISHGIPGEVTVAAVDEGILTLTDFNSPDPAKQLYAKRRLGVEIRDAYGRLLDPRVDALGNIRSGGDGGDEARNDRSAAGLPNKWIKPLALFSGPVTLDAKGRATIPLAIPEFNGQIRLMAVAYNANQVGHAEQKVIVRNKVVIELGLPRFLAPGDNAQLNLNLDNVDGAAGVTQLKFTTSGGIKLGNYPHQIKLAQKQKQQIQLHLSAEKLGDALLQLNYTLPDNTTHVRTWPLSVRSIQTYQDTVQSGILKPNATLHLDASLVRPVIPTDAMVSMTLNGVPDLQLARTIKTLDRYPYGCLEQTASRLLPLLYLPDVAAHLAKPATNAQDVPQARIDQAISHILSMQLRDGSFALWNSEGSSEEFLSLYAIDILQRAIAQKTAVPEQAMKNALHWLQDQINRGDFAVPILHRRAYAYYLLGKAGLIQPGQIRYFAERYSAQFPDRLSYAFTAAALTQIGDGGRAKPLWHKAFTFSVDTENDYNDYGSNIRDELITLTLYLENKQDPVAALKFAEQIDTQLNAHTELSTQDQGWLIIAAHALFGIQQNMQITQNDQSLQPSIKGQPIVQSWQGPNWQALQNGINIKNTGQEGVRYSIAVNGIPTALLPAINQGFQLQRHYFTREGKEVNLNAVQNNQLLVVLVEGVVTDKHVEDQCLLVDLLPAGLELESAQFGEGQAMQNLSWLGTLTTPTYQAQLDDRFIATFDPNSLNADKKAFRFAYAVRAVTPGHYQLPATTVEAMYRPQFRARLAPGTLDIH